MQITSNLNTITATQAYKSGNNVSMVRLDETSKGTIQNSTRELAKTIDPNNMSRNDARTIAETMVKNGNATIDNAFFLQSLVLVNENGELRTATDKDEIMNFKFNMFDALESSIKFNKSQGYSTTHLEKGLEFLQKLQSHRENTTINISA